MRTIWKGSLTFGLVNIPIRLYSASRTQELKFKLLHKTDNSEIRYARICKADGKEIPWQDIVKSYELEDGRYVILTPEDFQKADLKKTSSIEIVDFVDQNDIDPIYYEIPYYLEADKGAGKAYTLLRDALAKSKKVGIGNYVMRNHEHLAVIRPYGDYLLLNQLRYDNEIVKPDDLKVPTSANPTKKEMDIALQLIDQLTRPFHPEEYVDTYNEELKQLIDKKAKGHKIKIKTEETAPSKVHDIMTLLKESLDQNKKKTKSRRKA
jgi:DNA end-binding protein Ku